jgi:hypothetical protein
MLGMFLAGVTQVAQSIPLESAELELHPKSNSRVSGHLLGFGAKNSINLSKTTTGQKGIKPAF